MSDNNDGILLLPHDKLIAKMATDLYFGNGKPALTVRMALQEERMETVESNISDIKDAHRRFNFLLVTTLLSSVGGLVILVIEIVKQH